MQLPPSRQAPSSPGNQPPSAPQPPTSSAAMSKHKKQPSNITSVSNETTTITQNIPAPGAHDGAEQLESVDLYHSGPALSSEAEDPTSIQLSHCLVPTNTSRPAHSNISCVNSVTPHRRWATSSKTGIPATVLQVQPSSGEPYRRPPIAPYVPRTPTYRPDASPGTPVKQNELLSVNNDVLVTHMARAG